MCHFRCHTSHKTRKIHKRATQRTHPQGETHHAFESIRENPTGTENDKLSQLWYGKFEPELN